MNFGIGDIRRLNLMPRHLEHGPDHDWQLDFIKAAVRAGKADRLKKLIFQHEEESLALSEQLCQEFKGREIKVDNVNLSDDQMAGLEPLNKRQSLYLRLYGLRMTETAEGLFICPAPDCRSDDRAGVRARSAWLYLEASWQERQKLQAEQAHA